MTIDTDATPAATGPLWSDDKPYIPYSRLRRIMDHARTTWAYSIDRGFDALWQAYVRHEIDAIAISKLRVERARLTKEHGELNSIIDGWEKSANVLNEIIRQQQAELDKLKEEAANPRQSDAPAWRAYEMMVDNLEAANTTKGTAMNSDVLDTIEAALERCLSDSWFLDEAQGDVARQDIKVALAEVRRQREADGDLPEEEKESDRQEADRMIAIMRLREAGPQPNWDDEPWANYWAVDANGREVWFTVEPYCDDDEGACWCGQYDADGKYDPGIYGKKIVIPLGIDWRTLKCRRTQAGEV